MWISVSSYVPASCHPLGHRPLIFLEEKELILVLDTKEDWISILHGDRVLYVEPDIWDFNNAFERVSS